MIMNYVLSFCKITAASRIFSRNFYLPLLKPLTPKDALRTFKITGKWLLGSKIQHYIPVLLNHKKKRQKKVKNYGKVKHQENSGYTYMTPVLDPLNENHEILMNILNSKEGEGAFVYTVNDRMYNIVFSSQLELAIRDGDIIDIIVSQSNDKILIKLKNFKKIPVELDFYSGGSDELLNGEGGTSIDEEQFHHHGKYTMKLAKIFEAKEQEADEWEMEMLKIVAKKKRQRGEGTQEWNEMVNESIQNLDWQQFEVDAKKVIDQIMEPVVEEHIGMQVEDLEKTKNVADFINKNSMMDQLPSMIEIPDVVKNMATATFYDLESIKSDGSEEDVFPKLSGIKVVLSSGKECFIPGQMVKSEDGDVFVPGQTIKTEFGFEYAPGITINMNNMPALIKGLIMGEDNEKPMFVPTESTITSDGQLTFITNPSERAKNLKPKKIFVKRKKAKTDVNGKKKKRKSPEKHISELLKQSDKPEQLEGDLEIQKTEKIVGLDYIHEIEGICHTEIFNSYNEDSSVMESTNEASLMEDIMGSEICSESEEQDIIEYQRKPVEEIKPIDDGINKVIAKLEDKKYALQEKLEALRRLTITLENSVTFVGNDEVMQAAQKISPQVDKIEKISDILLAMCRKTYSFRERHDMKINNVNYSSEFSGQDRFDEAESKYNSLSSELKTTLKSAIYAANEVFKTRSKDQLLALTTISDLLLEPLRDKNILEELCNAMNTNLDRNEVCTSLFKDLTTEIIETKLSILKHAVDSFNLNGISDELIDALFKVVNTDGSNFSAVFKKLVKNNQILTKNVMRQLNQSVLDTLDSDASASSVLSEYIINSVQQYSQDCLLHLFVSADQYEIRNFISEAIALAMSLDMTETFEELQEMAAEKEINIMCCEGYTLDFLKRLTIIRELCKRDYSLKNALERLKRKPECGKTDPRIRQLVVESAVITFHRKPLRNSTDIPLKLFQRLNWLAIEDYVTRNTGGLLSKPVLVSRRGIQAVVPQEAEKNVLAGRVSYTLIDERGMNNFKPMHMFSNALKLGKSKEELNSYNHEGGITDKSKERDKDSPRRLTNDVRRNSGALASITKARMLA